MRISVQLFLSDQECWVMKDDEFPKQMSGKGGLMYEEGGTFQRFLKCFEWLKVQT